MCPCNWICILHNIMVYSTNLNGLGQHNTLQSHERQLLLISRCVRVYSCFTPWGDSEDALYSWPSIFYCYYCYLLLACSRAVCLHQPQRMWCIHEVDGPPGAYISRSDFSCLKGGLSSGSVCHIPSSFNHSCVHRQKDTHVAAYTAHNILHGWDASMVQFMYPGVAQKSLQVVLATEIRAAQWLHSSPTVISRQRHRQRSRLDPTVNRRRMANTSYSDSSQDEKTDNLLFILGIILTLPIWTPQCMNHY